MALTRRSYSSGLRCCHDGHRGQSSFRAAERSYQRACRAGRRRRGRVPRHGGPVSPRRQARGVRRGRAERGLVDAPTGFMECVFKTRRGIQWALDSGYDYVFSVPTDCYIVIPQLLASGYEKLDYTGYQVPYEGHMGGGSGYWLSKRAMEIVAARSPILDYEDRWVGQVLRENGIFGVHDPRYWSYEQARPLSSIITAHLSLATGIYEPNWMREMHEKFLRDGEI